MRTSIKLNSFDNSIHLVPERISLKKYVIGKKRFFVLKRTSDVILSFLILLVLIPVVFPIIALLIKLDSRGPVFFVQKRVGLGGRSFSCFKFRTMVASDDADLKQSGPNDSRITRCGRFLRNCNLDEFPQFINVLLGDMSIVGPRPHMHSDCAKFSSAIPDYKFRTIVKPGITGLAQSKGLRGPTQDFKSMFHRYQFDAFYVRNANFWMDVRIVRQTAAQTFRILLIHLDKLFSVKLFEYSRSFNSFF